MSDKSINLGKLQDEVRKAEALVKSKRIVLVGAYTEADNATQVLENARRSLKDAIDALDTARRAMVEAARAVANSAT